jgi:hypothetical protein
MQKVIRDGKVAVLYSPGYGAGWYTWNTEHPECLFHPEIVAIVEAGGMNEDDITEVAHRLFGEGFYAGGGDELKIEWIPQGEQFRVEEYDGSESITLRSDGEIWTTA